MVLPSVVDRVPDAVKVACPVRRRGGVGALSLSCDGPQGPMGPNGVCCTRQHAHLGLTELTNVAAGSAIPIDENFYISGTNITHVVPSSSVLLAPGSAYSVEYTIVANPPPTYGLNIVLRLDGVNIRGSRARSPETALEIDGFVSSSGGAIFRTTGSQTNVLEFVIDSGTTPTLVDELSIRIFQLD
ncbi:hypothetical protein [Pasteuria penetrans]|uniref:hypothetical protein n=1 Tax=Pasteuria penetrans TaxID=86005 RepID=UPI000FB1F849|nr:hypothetical protein [Pasteuria penetrans]